MHPAYFERGTAYALRSKHGIKDYDDRAIADLTEAIHLGATTAIGYYVRALVYGKKKDYDRAIADYTDAIRLDPKNAEAYRSARGV